jgi:hypothetical protein
MAENSSFARDYWTGYLQVALILSWEPPQCWQLACLRKGLAQTSIRRLLFTRITSTPGMPIIIPAWDIGILSFKRSSQNQFNECRCPPLMMKSQHFVGQVIRIVLQG